MTLKRLGGLVVMAAGAMILSACSGGGHASSTQSVAPSGGATASVDADGVPNGGAPTVQNPLPDTIFDNDPCSSALTADQLAKFLGTPLKKIPGSDQLGPRCGWDNSDTGAGFTVSYQTKSDQGISLAYRNAKPVAARWVNLDPVQGFPAAGYVVHIEQTGTVKDCVVVVGASDKLAYSVSIVLGRSASKAGKDPCMAGRQVADAVMTNLKARA